MVELSVHCHNGLTPETEKERILRLAGGRLARSEASSKFKAEQLEQVKLSNHAAGACLLLNQVPLAS